MNQIDCLIIDKDKIDELISSGHAVGVQWRWVTKEKACELLGVKPTSLYKLQTNGEIEFSNPTGGRAYYDIESLNRWIEKHRVESVKKI